VNAGSPETDSAGALLVRIAGGDRDAFAELHVQTSRAVSRVTNALLRSAEHAEEVAQEVYLQIWLNGAAAFTPTLGSGQGFVMALARRRAIDRIRYVERSRRRDTSWVEPADTAWDFTDAAADRDRLLSALDSLGVQSQTIVAVYYDGLSYSETAQRLGVSLAAMKSRHHRAMAALRSQLQS
jgi:RNA polymerase sigma-70 factor (ECF subfamily)